jgi:hypothetical protein
MGLSRAGHLNLKSHFVDLPSENLTIKLKDYLHTRSHGPILLSEAIWKGKSLVKIFHLPTKWDENDTFVKLKNGRRLIYFL